MKTALGSALPGALLAADGGGNGRPVSHSAQDILARMSTQVSFIGFQPTSLGPLLCTFRHWAFKGKAAEASVCR